MLTWLNEKTTKEGLEVSNANHREAMNFFQNNILVENQKNLSNFIEGAITTQRKAISFLEERFAIKDM